MQIINKTRGSVLADNIVVADTPFKRMKGLLGRDVFNKGEALILKPANSIHTFFMRFPIGLLFVDKNNRVIKAVSSLKPYRLVPICWHSKYVVELPTGAILSSSTQQGDILQIS